MNKKKRKLTLRKETVAQLSELNLVAAAAWTDRCVSFTPNCYPP